MHFAIGVEIVRMYIRLTSPNTSCITLSAITNIIVRIQQAITRQFCEGKESGTFVNIRRAHNLNIILLTHPQQWFSSTPMRVKTCVPVGLTRN